MKIWTFIKMRGVTISVIQSDGNDYCLCWKSRAWQSPNHLWKFAINVRLFGVFVVWVLVGVMDLTLQDRMALSSQHFMDSVCILRSRLWNGGGSEYYLKDSNGKHTKVLKVRIESTRLIGILRRNIQPCLNWVVSLSGVNISNLGVGWSLL